MEIAATGTTIWLHESSLISFMGNTRLRYSGLTVSFWVEYVMLCSSMYKPPPMIPLRHKLHTKVFPIILPPPISWWLVKLSISYWFPEEHPYIGDFSRFTAYVRTRDWYARTQRFARSAPYTAVSPSESPLHFADRRDESVIVGYYTSAEAPFPRRKQPGCTFVELFCAANPHRPQAMWAGIPKRAQHPWHTTLVQSLVCYTFPEVYTFLKCKKPHTQHLNGADMGLDASSA